VVSLGASAAISAILVPRLPAALPLGRLLAFLPVGVWIVATEPPLWGVLIGLAAFSYGVSVAMAVWVYLQSLSAADVAVRLRAADAESRDLALSLSVALDAERVSRARIETEARLRERFGLAVSLDLRQTIGALRLHTLALGRGADVQRTRDHSRIALDCLASADATVESVAQAAWLMESASSLALEHVDLGATLSRLHQECQPLFQQAGTDLVLVPTSLHVHADLNFLDRVIRNLVHNALRHARATRVLIGARRRGASVEIVVADNGRGISPEDRARIFERFYQGADPAQRQTGSVGLGLAIVREMAGHMGGTVRLSSQPGKGALFALTFARAMPVAISIARDKPSRCVLVLDDDPASLDHLADTVAAAGGVPLRCSNLTEAQRAGPADAYIVDFHLDGGATALDLLNGMPQRERDRTLVVSSNLIAPLAAKVRAMGCDIAVKPVPADRIRGFLAELGKPES
jgi:signal transduction histidine kinase